MNRQQLFDLILMCISLPIWIFAVIKGHSDLWSFPGLMILVGSVGLFCVALDFSKRRN